MSQKEDIYERARELGIVSGYVNGSQLDTMQKIAEEVGMDHYNGLSNDDTDELQRRLKEYEKKRLENNQNSSEEAPKASQNLVNRGLNGVTGGAWNKARNAPIIGAAARKAEDKLANKFGNTRLGQAMDNHQRPNLGVQTKGSSSGNANGTQSGDVGKQNLKNSLANRARNFMQKKKKNKGKNEDSASGENTAESTSSENTSSSEESDSEEKVKIKLKRKLLIKIAAAGLFAFGLYVFFMIIATIVTGGKSFQAGPFIASSSYDTEEFESVTKEDSTLHEDELNYYKKMKEVQDGDSGVNVNYVNALLMQLYYEASFEYDEEFEETGGIDYATATGLIDKIVETIKNTGAIDYSADGEIFNALKESEDLKKYYKKVLETEKMEDVLARAFELAEELEAELNAELGVDDTVLSEETKVTVVETKNETGTENKTKTKTLTINEYIANSIYANSTTLNSESVKAYTIAYSTKLASQNNKLSIDSNSVSASNSLCSVSLGCSYDVDGNLVSGGNDQSTKNTYFYKGQYYYKKPLNSEEITTLNKDINSVFGNVLVNSDGTYPDLDVEKINGLGDSYKTILTNSYGNLSYKNIGEDSYILDGSYGTKQVKSSVIFYDQNDFASYNFCGKKNETIKSSGCGTTSMAIIVSTYEKNSKYDPVFMTGEARKTGYCGGGITGTSPGFFKKEANTMKYKYYKASKYSKKDLNLVLQHLSQGHLVIAHMSAGHFTSGGHYMVLGGVDPDTKKVYVYDPYSKVNKSYRGTGSGWYSFNDIIVKEAWNFYIIWKG